jgi:alkylation response protein AidB-like acyl-CoA dehydrogenase
MSFQIPEHVLPIRKQVQQFIEERIYPVEQVLEEPGDESRATLRRLMQEAKDAGLWALGHPKEIGGQGMPFLDYVYVNEVIGRSEYAQVCLGTHSLQDSIMLNLHSSPEWRDRYLKPLVAGEIFPSFGMTEPAVAGSDPTQMKTKGVLDGDDWVITGRKWFTSGAKNAAYTTVMCRTEFDNTPVHKSFSMIVVPTDTPGYNIVRETPVMGMMGGHCEVEYDNVRVPRANLLGPRGQGFLISQQRLGPGRIFHCMRWLGQAQRAFDLMCDRANSRIAFGSPLADKQQIQTMIFDTASEIQASRLLTLSAAHKMDKGDPARVEIGIIKVVGAAMLHNAIDRAIQVYGAAGVTSDLPLERMYRHARFARIYDGPDEVHRSTVARLIAREYAKGAGWDFGTR